MSQSQTENDISRAQPNREIDHQRELSYIAALQSEAAKSGNPADKAAAAEAQSQAAQRYNARGENISKMQRQVFGGDRNQ